MKGWFTNKARKENEGKREYERQMKEARRDAEYWLPVLIESFARLGAEHWLRKDARPDNILESMVTGVKARQVIQIADIRYTPNAVYYRLDPRQLPHGTNLEFYSDPKNLATVESAIRKPVRWRYTIQGGAWFVIDRDGSVSGIPEKFLFRTAIKNLPASKPPLSFVVGVGENGRLYVRDLAELIHMFIAGATGQGKSNELNNILSTFVLRNEPTDLELYNIDLKGGVELGDYAELPHVKAFVTEAVDVPGMLKQYADETEKRLKVFSKFKIRSLAVWNRRYPDEHLPYLVLVIDELAHVLKDIDTKLAKEAGLHLGRIVQRSRAVGGHAILCTQRPSGDVVEGWIKTNVPARIAFSLPSKPDSIVVIGNGDAAQLHPKGRAIFQEGADFHLLQAPMMEDYDVEKAVRQVLSRGGKPVIERPASVTFQEIAEYAHRHMDDKLPHDDLYKVFKLRGVTQRDFRALLTSMDDQSVTVDGTIYRVVYDGRKKIGRRLEEDHTVFGLEDAAAD